ncbi:DNA-binding protein BIN4 isoform X2 [Carica papaya]|uniref:DNA-binding protein BIN4 isoform X2 n=1 Tax=Carica papaya TaxID=3649 RepID=UPI000B8CF8EB|nr:DNA-binding protein BIN4 isoform X2 [Carica papaya]
MSNSREQSPDWLHAFQAPTCSTLSIPSDSNASPRSSPSREDTDVEKEPSIYKLFPVLERGKKHDASADAETSPSKKSLQMKSPKKQPKAPAVWMLSSDSESDSKTIEKRKDMVMNDRDGDSTIKKASKRKSPRKQLKVEGNNPCLETAEEGPSEKPTQPHVSTSRLPLVLSEKVHRSKALVECEGESIDLSGDMGAVGRIVVSDTPSGNHEMYLDLKGTMYKTTIVPSHTFCVVSFGQSEAKIEAIMNDFIQLKPQSNVYEAETMVEGTMDGFLFESDDETEKMPKTTTHQNDQNEGAEEQANGKTKHKAEKKSGSVRKGSRPTKGKLQTPKKVKKKSAVSKKTKAKTKK